MTVLCPNIIAVGLDDPLACGVDGPLSQAPPGEQDAAAADCPTDAVADEAAAAEELPEDVDAIEVNEPELLAAVHFSRPATLRKSEDRRATWSSFLLAVFIHALIAAGCLALMRRFLLPTADFASGAGSSQGGIVSAEASQGDLLPESLPQAPTAISLPPSSIDRRPVAVESDPDFDATKKPILELTDSESEPIAIGLSGSEIAKFPVRPHARESITHSAGKPAMASAPARLSVAHSFVGPRGAGTDLGSGTSGSGLDSRGLPLPEYPPESLRRHEQGAVEFLVIIREDGSVASVQLHKTSGFPRLDKAALTALRTARFTPAQLDEKPVAVSVIIPFRFQIN
jgi:TonB family protein